jgi:NAD(P)-dependent dehydrogenase (short-subunit alcohol dehydrogenase family)
MSVFSSFRKINAKILTRMEKNRILITGANQGIGLATAIKLARKGYCDITIACRNEDRARSAVQTILDVTSNDILVRFINEIVFMIEKYI